MKRVIITILIAFGLGIGASLAPAHAGTSPNEQHIAAQHNSAAVPTPTPDLTGTNDGIWQGYPTWPKLTWCATVQVTNFPPGSGKATAGDHVVLGSCSNGTAASQQWTAVNGSGGYELVSALKDGITGIFLCITMHAKAGQADGQSVLVGDCTRAITQLYVPTYSYDRGIGWVDYDILDNNGNPFTLNLANDVRSAGQPYNVSWPQLADSETLTGAGCYSDVC